MSAGANFHNDDDVKVTTTVLDMLRRLWPYFMRHRVLFFTTIAAVIAVAAAARISIWLFGYLIDEGIAKKDQNLVLWLALIYFVIEASRSFMTFLHTYLFAKIGNRILYDLRDELLTHVQRLPIGFFDKNPTGRIVTRLTSDVVSLGEVFTQGLINMFASFIALATIVIAMLLISVKVTVVSLALAPPIIWGIARLTEKIFVVLRESRKRLAMINAFVAENINGMRVLQLYGRTGRAMEKFAALSKDYRIQQLLNVKLYALLWPLVNVFNAVAVTAALYYGGHLALEGSLTTGAMVAFILHLRSLSDPISTILEQYQTLQNSLAGGERIFSLFAEEQERPSPRALAPAAEGRFRGDVEFKNVHFRYGDGLPLALESMSLSVRAGESVALVGRTGSGKSTLISLLQRFYDPTDGVIEIDGTPLQDYSRRLLRSRLGVVQQDTFLFRGTIADNISMGDPRITRESVERAARMASLTELLGRREGHLDAWVEERGANLSVGERQLIAFARILAFDPDILILDEATANIDSRTEGLIQEATAQARRGRTSFIIAHRLSTILDCDKIVVLDGGKVVEVGRHEELLARGGRYASMHQSSPPQPTRAP